MSPKLFYETKNHFVIASILQKVLWSTPLLHCFIQGNRQPSGVERWPSRADIDQIRVINHEPDIKRVVACSHTTTEKKTAAACGMPLMAVVVGVYYLYLHLPTYPDWYAACKWVIIACYTFRLFGMRYMLNE